jgi:hypothetical protein
LIAFGIDWSRSHGKVERRRRKQSNKESRATKKAEQQRKQADNETRATKNAEWLQMDQE